MAEIFKILLNTVYMRQFSCRFACYHIIISQLHTVNNACMFRQLTGRLDWIVQCFTSPPTQYRLYGRRFLQVQRPNQQYQGLCHVISVTSGLPVMQFRTNVIKVKMH